MMARLTQQSCWASLGVLGEEEEGGDFVWQAGLKTSGVGPSCTGMSGNTGLWLRDETVQHARSGPIPS